ncbi:IS66-like element accessory protein TnpA [Falsiroseomonas sp. HW251]|uniref:IS66-like element accessory protein TnpA n=1 Tax=Falsiroseomonas sp. HW251 TaxID=3390998 RepID=UPI003D31E2DF
MEIEAEAAETGRRTGRKTARKPRPGEVVEVVTRGEGRRGWSSDQKRRIVVEAMQLGVTPTEVIRRWGLTSSLFYTWRRQVMSGELGAVPAPLAAFAQVAVAEDAPVLPLPAPECPARPPARIEVVLPDGTTLRLDEDVGADALRRLLAVLRGR